MHKFDGGGSILKENFTQRVREFVEKRDKPFKQCLEWCAGMGEIGRDLLKNKLIEKLILLDINKKALDEGDKKWGSKNIRYYQSDNLTNLNKYEKFDLVVGNPPSYCNINIKHPSFLEWEGDLRPLDKDWKLRKGFYKNIAKYMTLDGIILVNEVELYKDKVFIGELWDDRPKPPVGEFMDMIESNGLRIKSCSFLRDIDGVAIYMMESRVCGSYL